jgi:hypothetical protein
MLLDSIIEPISDLSTVAGQTAVEYIADHSSLKRDGWFLTAVRVLVATVVFFLIGVVIPILLLALIWWAALKLLFPG